MKVTNSVNVTGVNKLITFIFLGGGGIVARLPEIFARPGVRIIVYGRAENPLAESMFVDEYRVLPPAENNPDEKWSDTLIRNAHYIAQESSDWIIVENDLVAYDIARSELPLEIKLSILPCRSEAALTMLGSKVGLSQIAQQLGLPYAPSVVAHTPQQLQEVASNWEGAAHLKGDLGGGGSSVVAFENLAFAELSNLPVGWFPVVVQQTMPGTLSSVEALFIDGALMGWIYAEIIHNRGEMGPSIRRRYLQPPKNDFIDTLNTLGRALLLHGFYNCSFIWDEQSQTHWLFEADPRPNLWHQFGPYLGMDWVEVIRSETHTPTGQVVTRSSTVLSLWPRTIIHFGLSKNLMVLMPWLLGLPGTWRTRNTRDRCINKMDRATVRESLGITKRLNILKDLWAKL